MPATLKAYKGIGLEGPIARWYASTTGRDLTQFRDLAGRIAAELQHGAAVLEVAPGPGYLAIELARSGLRVAAVDISHSFVEIGRANAARAGVEIDFRHGNAAALPFEEGTFDSVVCRAAFKNFTEPARAVSEMRRVLKPGGRAVIVDMRREASGPAIDACVKEMGLGRVNSLLTKWSLRGLVSRAYSRAQLREIISQAGFRSWRISDEGIGFELSLEK